MTTSVESLQVSDEPMVGSGRMPVEQVAAVETAVHEQVDQSHVAAVPASRAGESVDSPLGSGRTSEDEFVKNGHGFTNPWGPENRQTREAIAAQKETERKEAQRLADEETARLAAEAARTAAAAPMAKQPAAAKPAPEAPKTDEAPKVDSASNDAKTDTKSDLSKSDSSNRDRSSTAASRPTVKRRKKSVGKRAIDAVTETSANTWDFVCKVGSEFKDQDRGVQIFIGGIAVTAFTLVGYREMTRPASVDKTRLEAEASTNALIHYELPAGKDLSADTSQLLAFDSRVITVSNVESTDKKYRLTTSDKGELNVVVGMVTEENGWYIVHTEDGLTSAPKTDEEKRENLLFINIPKAEQDAKAYEAKHPGETAFVLNALKNAKHVRVQMGDDGIIRNADTSQAISIAKSITKEDFKTMYDPKTGITTQISDVTKG